ncbi:MAG: YqhA family protein [Chloroflexia bacterium]
MLRRIAASSRYMVILAVVCIAVAATVTFVYGGVLTARFVALPFRDGVNPTTTKAMILGAIEIVDVFLLGITMYVIALGMYELFVDQNLSLPRWLQIEDLDDLKAKLLGVVVVVLGVVFLGQVIAWDGVRDMLRFGGGIALVIAALTYFIGPKPPTSEGKERQG